MYSPPLCRLKQLQAFLNKLCGFGNVLPNVGFGVSISPSGESISPEYMFGSSLLEGCTPSVLGIPVKGLNSVIPAAAGPSKGAFKERLPSRPHLGGVDVMALRFM